MKRIKEIVILDMVVVVFLIWWSFPNILSGKTLYLFSNFIAEGIFRGLCFLLMALLSLFLNIKYVKEYRLGRKIICSLLFIVMALYSVYDIADTVSSFSAKEEINLPDGNNIVLYEKKSRSETSITVYMVKGIIAKKIGYCYESYYCDECCLKENKWDHTYNEADKKLTLILRYDEPKGKYNPDVLEKEFTLE